MKNVKNTVRNFFANTNPIQAFLFIILILSIPLTVVMIRSQQDVRQRAAGCVVDADCGAAGLVCRAGICQGADSGGSAPQTPGGGDSSPQTPGRGDCSSSDPNRSCLVCGSVACFADTEYCGSPTDSVCCRKGLQYCGNGQCLASCNSSGGTSGGQSPGGGNQTCDNGGKTCGSDCCTNIYICSSNGSARKCCPPDKPNLNANGECVITPIGAPGGSNPSDASKSGSQPTSTPTPETSSPVSKVTLQIDKPGQNPEYNIGSKITILVTVDQTTPAKLVQTSLTTNAADTIWTGTIDKDKRAEFNLPIAGPAEKRTLQAFAVSESGATLVNSPLVNYTVIEGSGPTTPTPAPSTILSWDPADGGLILTPDCTILRATWISAKPPSEVKAYRVKWGLKTAAFGPNYTNDSGDIASQTNYAITGLTDGNVYNVTIEAKDKDGKYIATTAKEGTPQCSSTKTSSASGQEIELSDPDQYNPFATPAQYIVPAVIFGGILLFFSFFF